MSSIRESVRGDATGDAASELPWMISVDDHILEPRDLWQQELPPSLRSRGPQVVRERVKLAFTEWNYGAGGDISGGVATAGDLDVLLVVGVIYVFLGRATDTLIPAVALPMSLLLTVAVTYILIRIVLPGMMNSMGVTAGQAFLGLADRMFAEMEDRGGQHRAGMALSHAFHQMVQRAHAAAHAHGRDGVRRGIGCAVLIADGVGDRGRAGEGRCGDANLRRDHA